MLVDVLRDRVGLTGPRATCGVGLCGTCTVLLDGEPVSVLHHDGAAGHRTQITTVEGLPDDDQVWPASTGTTPSNVATASPGWCSPPGTW